MKAWIHNILHKLTYVIPKKRNLHVYLPAHDKGKFSGNIRAMMIYAKKHHPEIDSVVLTLNPATADEASRFGIRSIQNRILYYWYLFRAEIVFTDTTQGAFRFGRYRFVQLWHGIGFKNVGFLWEKEGHIPEKRKEIYRSIYSRCILVAASSESNAKIQNASFVTDKAMVTGYPRNDIFFEENLPEKIKEKLNLQTYSGIITYAPTFRDRKTEQPFSAGFWEKLNILLRKRNEVFVIKKHPFEAFLQVPENLSNIKDLTREISDTQELLLITDLLITDYSSISTDFSITNKPVLIYAYDLDAYIKTCRGMAYDLEKTLPKPLIRTEGELFQMILQRDWMESPEAIKSYKNFQKMFHYYFDGHSSSRIMKKVLSL